MLVKVIALAGFVMGAGIGLAYAQNGGPAEFPPAEYQGQSYVDSQGCIYLKAGYGGQATWLPRVGPDRKPICGQTPTRALEQVSGANGGVQAAPARVRSIRDGRNAKSSGQRVFTPSRVTIGCPASVPVARRYATTDGGSVVLCTATNGSLTGARPPLYPTGSGTGAALSPNRYGGPVIPLAKTKRAAVPGSGKFVPPEGYEVAWKDGRLNPLRAQSTVSGQAAQDRVWTRDVPAKAVTLAPTPRSPGQATLSASNGSTAGAFYVQIGAFAQAANATGAAARLVAVGLPVAKRKSGISLQIIFAGPFRSGADAASALRTARAAGFSDAFIR